MSINYLKLKKRMKTFLSNACFVVAFLAILSCSKKEEVTAEKAPDLTGKWTIKTAKNLSASTLTAKASSTIEFTTTKYTVSQTQPFANYKNPSNVTEYLRLRNATYKLLTVEESLVLLEADLKLVYGTSYATVYKNISNVLALYKKDGIKYVAKLDDASFVVTDPAFGTITVQVPGFGVANFTATSFALEALDFVSGQDPNKTTFVAKLPARRGQILLEK